MTCPQIVLNIVDECDCEVNRHCTKHCAYCERYYAGGKTNRNIDAIMWWCDEMFLAGKFRIVNRILPELEPDELGVDSILTWLTMTAQPPCHLMYNRPEFFRKCKASLEKRGEPELDRLLQGLQ